jgi:hypothetical protein
VHAALSLKDDSCLHWVQCRALVVASRTATIEGRGAVGPDLVLATKLRQQGNPKALVHRETLRRWYTRGVVC